MEYEKIRLRFDVFGHEIVVDRLANGWRPLIVGPEEKSRPVDFSIPAELAEDEVLGYLDDLFHERATPENPRVRRI